MQDIPIESVDSLVNLILEMMSDRLSFGGRIEIRGFGSFSLHYKLARNAHYPKTGDRVITEPKYSPHFKPGKNLRDRANNANSSIAIYDGDV